MFRSLTLQLTCSKKNPLQTVWNGQKKQKGAER